MICDGDHDDDYDNDDDDDVLHTYLFEAHILVPSSTWYHHSIIMYKPMYFGMHASIRQPIGGLQSHVNNCV